MIPITDTMRMDSFDPNVPHAYDVYKQCGGCAEWSIYDNRKTYTQENRQTCPLCGSTNLVIGSIISHRTFNAERAKEF